jgi:hypothetical protein
MAATESKKCKCILVLICALPLAGCVATPKSTSPTSTQSSVVTVQLNETSVTLKPNGQQWFVATVSGTTNISVNWTVDSLPGGNATVGTISTIGLYVAPPSSGKHTVTATSVADTKKSVRIWVDSTARTM